MIKKSHRPDALNISHHLAFHLRGPLQENVIIKPLKLFNSVSLSLSPPPPLSLCLSPSFPFSLVFPLTYWSLIQNHPFILPLTPLSFLSLSLVLHQPKYSFLHFVALNQPKKNNKKNPTKTSLPFLLPLSPCLILFFSVPRWLLCILSYAYLSLSLPPPLSLSPPLSHPQLLPFPSLFFYMLIGEAQQHDPPSPACHTTCAVMSHVDASKSLVTVRPGLTA